MSAQQRWKAAWLGWRAGAQRTAISEQMITSIKDAGYDVSLIAEPLLEEHMTNVFRLKGKALGPTTWDTHSLFYVSMSLCDKIVNFKKFISGFFSWLLSLKIYCLVSILVRATLTSWSPFSANWPTESAEIALNQCFSMCLFHRIWFHKLKGLVIKIIWGNAKLNKIKDVLSLKHLYL